MANNLSMDILEKFDKRCFIHYSPPPSPNALGRFPIGVKEAWIERMEFLISDLVWLLQLKQKSFWSHLVANHDGSMTAIASFLQDASPYYLVETFPQEKEMVKLYHKLSYVVFLIFNRLITAKESREEEGLTDEAMAKLWYSNYLFSIPILLDLSLIYAKDNGPSISRMISLVFQMQPWYTDDLIKAIPYFVKVLKGVQQKFDCYENVRKNGELVKLADKNGERVNAMTLMELRDLVIHVLDTATTLSIFLDMYTPACNVFHDQLFEMNIVNFYENTFREMYQKVETLANSAETQLTYEDLQKKLDLSRVEMLKIYRLIVSSIINSALESTGDDDHKKDMIEDYVSILTDSLQDKTFIRDYHTEYPVEVDLELLAQLSPEMDTMKCNFLQESVLACFEIPPLPRQVSNLYRDAVAPVPCLIPTDYQNGSGEQVGGIELESLITEVKDILPDLGDGFIQLCLEHFQFVSADVINAVLEGTLPAALTEMDFTLAREKPEEVMDNYQRLNAFDNDEFDIMTQDRVDTSRIHQGKRQMDHKNLKEMIDDKTHRSQFREMYTKFGLVDTEGSMYDDEYDDTYDHVDVNVGEAGSEGRTFEVPRVLRALEKHASSEEESVGEDVERVERNEMQAAGGFVPFVQNPEMLRAKAEQRRLTRGGYHGEASRSRDVVGVAKGHGQDKAVVNNRNNKTKRGNPNRQAGAARKRQGGMIPS